MFPLTYFVKKFSHLPILCNLSLYLLALMITMFERFLVELWLSRLSFIDTTKNANQPLYTEGGSSVNSWSSVPPASPNPDLISDQILLFSTPICT